MTDPTSPLANFGGVARLFPLPNLVFFPHAMQPLHIFEPRYRQMTADALAGDRLIAMVLPMPGWETNYAGSMAIHPVATLGTIVADQKLDDGRYNLLLKGLSRVQVGEELMHSKLYRKARVELLAEVPIASTKGERRWRRQLKEKIPLWFPDQKAVLVQFNKLLQSDLPLGPLCDILAFALPLEVESKQALLEELEVEQRLARLVQFFDAQQPAAPDASPRKFPPEFSAN